MQSHILIVDDTATNRLKMSLAMTALGYSSQVAEDGARALELLRTHSFDLVLLDILMPRNGRASSAHGDEIRQ